MVLVAFAEAGKRGKVSKLADYRLNASSATPRPQGVSLPLLALFGPAAMSDLSP